MWLLLEDAPPDCSCTLPLAGCPLFDADIFFFFFQLIAADISPSFHTDGTTHTPATYGSSFDPVDSLLDYLVLDGYCGFSRTSDLLMGMSSMSSLSSLRFPATATFHKALAIFGYLGICIHWFTMVLFERHGLFHFPHKRCGPTCTPHFLPFSCKHSHRSRDHLRYQS